MIRRALLALVAFACLPSVAYGAEKCSPVAEFMVKIAPGIAVKVPDANMAKARELLSKAAHQPASVTDIQDSAYLVTGPDGSSFVAYAHKDCIGIALITPSFIPLEKLRQILLDESKPGAKETPA